MVLVHCNNDKSFWIIVGVVEQLAFGTTDRMVLTNEVEIFPTTALRFENEKTSVKKQVFPQRTFQNLQTSKSKVRHLALGWVGG